jgi:hypothetical protein
MKPGKVMALACWKIIYYFAVLGGFAEKIGSKLPTFYDSL